MSFTVLPSNTRSYVDEIFQCRDIAYHNIGKVVSSEYYSRDDAEVIGVQVFLVRCWPNLQSS